MFLWLPSSFKAEKGFGEEAQVFDFPGLQLLY